MVGRWLILLSGARSDVLDRCTGERTRFHGLGGAILTTASIAATSMTFALASALKLFPPLAVLVGAVWGAAILSLDRWLVTSLPVEGRRRFGFAVPRVLLALLLGAVISTPLVLQIFKPEIDAEIVDIQRERVDAFARAQQSGEIGQRIADLEKSAAHMEAVIASRGETALDPAADPRIQELNTSHKQAVGQRDAFYQEWQCQLYVGPPKCAKKGNGPLARKAEEAYNDAGGRVRDIDREIQRRRKELGDVQNAGKQSRLAQAQDGLRVVKTELDNLTGQQARLRDAFVTENRGSDGLLLRLESLGRVSQDNPTLNLARILLFLFILLIECLPVAVKLMQRPGAYDMILAELEKQEVNSAVDQIHEAGRRPGPRDSPTRQYIADEPRTHVFDEPGAPAEPPPAEPYESRSFEDEALRDLRDNRATRPGEGDSAQYAHAGPNDDW
jgi:hypothetical protein